MAACPLDDTYCLQQWWAFNADSMPVDKCTGELRHGWDSAVPQPLAAPRALQLMRCLVRSACRTTACAAAAAAAAACCPNSDCVVPLCLQNPRHVVMKRVLGMEGDTGALIFYLV